MTTPNVPRLVTYRWWPKMPLAALIAVIGILSTAVFARYLTVRLTGSDVAARENMSALRTASTNWLRRSKSSGFNPWISATLSTCRAETLLELVRIGGRPDWCSLTSRRSASRLANTSGVAKVVLGDVVEKLRGGHVRVYSSQTRNLILRERLVFLHRRIDTRLINGSAAALFINCHDSSMGWHDAMCVLSNRAPHRCDHYWHDKAAGACFALGDRGLIHGAHVGRSCGDAASAAVCCHGPCCVRPGRR